MYTYSHAYVYRQTDRQINRQTKQQTDRKHIKYKIYIVYINIHACMHRQIDRHTHTLRTLTPAISIINMAAPST